jgi:hypothetical protein
MSWLLERLESCSQVRHLLSELSDLATLVDEFRGEASQCEAEPLGAGSWSRAR